MEPESIQLRDDLTFHILPAQIVAEASSNFGTNRTVSKSSIGKRRCGGQHLGIKVRYDKGVS